MDDQIRSQWPLTTYFGSTRQIGVAREAIENSSRQNTSYSVAKEAETASILFASPALDENVAVIVNKLSAWVQVNGTFGFGRSQMCAGSTYAHIVTPGGIESPLPLVFQLHVVVGTLLFRSAGLTHEMAMKRSRPSNLKARSSAIFVARKQVV